MQLHSNPVGVLEYCGTFLHLNFYISYKFSPELAAFRKIQRNTKALGVTRSQRHSRNLSQNLKRHAPCTFIQMK